MTKLCASYPVGIFCGECGQPVHQDTPEGWNPAKTPARMLCRNPVCADRNKPFLFAPTMTEHPWADE